MFSFIVSLITKFYRSKYFLDVLLITKAGLIGSAFSFTVQEPDAILAQGLFLRPSSAKHRCNPAGLLGVR